MVENIVDLDGNLEIFNFYLIIDFPGLGEAVSGSRSALSSLPGGREEEERDHPRGV